jgi:cytochrome c biogenesis protein CcdA
VSESETTTESRWSGLGEVLGRAAVVLVAIAVGLGILGAVVALASDRGISQTIAGAYYIVGSILFLVGMVPTGGFSLMRGTVTKRNPLGSRFEPTFLLGLALVGLGVLIDVTRPF